MKLLELLEAIIVDRGQPAIFDKYHLFLRITLNVKKWVLTQIRGFYVLKVPLEFDRFGGTAPLR